jgi:hypothetical protein
MQLEVRCAHVPNDGIRERQQLPSSELTLLHVPEVLCGQVNQHLWSIQTMRRNARTPWFVSCRSRHSDDGAGCQTMAPTVTLLLANTQYNEAS